MAKHGGPEAGRDRGECVEEDQWRKITATGVTFTEIVRKVKE